MPACFTRQSFTVRFRNLQNRTWTRRQVEIKTPQSKSERCMQKTDLQSSSAPNSSAAPTGSHVPRLLLGMALCGFLLVVPGIVRGQSVGKGHASDVDPMIGTGIGPGPYPNSNGQINLFPGGAVPFGMVEFSPDTENHGNGYHYRQESIQDFSLTHMSGAGCPNAGEVPLMPTSGPVAGAEKDLASPYSHDQETAEAGYYSVHLARWNIDVQLAATTRTGEMRMMFPAGKAANLFVPISHTLNHSMSSSVRIVGDSRLEGYVENQVFCRRSGTYRVYFVISFDRPFSTFGTWDGEHGEQSRSRSAEQTSDSQQVGAYVSWPPADGPQAVIAQVAISYVDPAGAANNLQAEASGKDFNRIHQDATRSWNDALSVIETSGGTPRDQKVFYTALYHSLLMPNILSDADGRYLGFDGRTHSMTAGHMLYGNFSGWDIYRSQIPLLALIDPQRVQDMAQSIVLMYQQGGWIGKWPQINQYTNVMVGSPLTVILSTAWLDGLHGFDIESAWKGMYLDATQAAPPGKPYTGEEAMDWINRVHFAPNDKVRRTSVSETQEDTMAYASLYRLAVDLGKTDAAHQLYERALYYRNLFNPKNRFFQPRNADGTWVESFDPNESNHAFLEGSGWHYQWMAPWDMDWLIRAVGNEQFNQRMDAFFDYAKPAWTTQHYNPYNETDLEAPFEYNFSGQPWKAQRAVRRILSETYLDTPDGVPGNDDCGEMSSWAVLSMMGLYSIDPASEAYELVSPVFPKIVVRLQAPYSGKAFTIATSAHPESTPYIQKVELNGHPVSNWIPFHEIVGGGGLRFTLGSTPKETWGAAPREAPPSLSRSAP